MFLLIPFVLAGEPPVIRAPAALRLPRLHTAVVIPWSEIGYALGAPESVAYGPDLLAIGPDGAWAAWDPVHNAVVGTTSAPGVHAEGLAFTAEGDLLVLDARSRTLTRIGGGTAAGTAVVAMDRLCPTDVQLLVAGQVAVGRDAFGNLHPLADLRAGGLDPASGPRLLPPVYEITVRGGKVTVNGNGISAPADSLAARAIGDWVLVEAGKPGDVRTRSALSLLTLETVQLPLPGFYRPSSWIAAGPDGSLGYLDPESDGLHIVRVYP